jgi:sodium transport system permease protein
MNAKFLVILHKELREALRDRRALGVLLVMVVMYPLVLWFALDKMIDISTKGDHENVKVVVIGTPKVPTLLNLLKQKNIQVAARDSMADAEITELLRQHDYVAVIRVSDKFSDNYVDMRPARIELWFDSASDLQSKLRRVDSVLRGYNNTIAGARLLAHGVSPVVLSPILLQNYDIATNASRSVQFIGVLLGMFFVTTFIFCMNTAIDTTAGERERRSLEVLLAQPMKPISVIAGKWLATATLAIVGLTLELVVAHSILTWMPLEEIGMSWRVTLPMLFAVIASAVPLCLFAAAFEIALAMNAKTFKEAQTMMSLALLIPMLPAIIVPTLNLNTAMWMYGVPVLSNQTLLMEVAKGQAVGILPYLLTIGGSLLAAILAVAFAGWRLRSEKYVLSV